MIYPFLLCWLLAVGVWGEFEDTPSTDGQMELTIEHSFDQGESFQSRGVIQVHSIRSKSSSAEQSDLTETQWAEIKALCRIEGLYQLRIMASRPGSETSSRHLAVADPCQILSKGLHDVLTLHLDWKGQLVSISVASSPVSYTRSTGASQNKFKTKIQVQNMEAGPQPDTAAFIQKMDQEKLAQQRGETPDNRSFIAKYWMYIIPVVLMLAMSSANPEGQAAGRR